MKFKSQEFLCANKNASINRNAAAAAAAAATVVVGVVATLNRTIC